jgi:hypothetical protein
MFNSIEKKNESRLSQVQQSWREGFIRDGGVQWCHSARQAGDPDIVFGSVRILQQEVSPE